MMEKVMDDSTFVMGVYMIDRDQLHRATLSQSVLDGGIHVFHSNSNDVRAMKRLLHDIFDVPVRGRVHPMNNRIR